MTVLTEPKHCSLLSIPKWDEKRCRHQSDARIRHSENKISSRRILDCFFFHIFAVNSVKIRLLGQNVALCLHYKMPCLNDRDDISMPLRQEGSSGQRHQIGHSSSFIFFQILHKDGPIIYWSRSPWGACWWDLELCIWNWIEFDNWLVKTTLRLHWSLADCLEHSGSETAKSATQPRNRNVKAVPFEVCWLQRCLQHSPFPSIAFSQILIPVD